MLQINPAILSDKPTHRHDGVLVKVFKDRQGPSYSIEGERVGTAEIMEGPNEGKWTTVYYSKLEAV